MESICLRLYRRLFSMTSKKRNSSSSAIQALYDLCTESFTSSSPPLPHAIAELTSVLDSIGPADVGLNDDSKKDDRGHGPYDIFSFNRVDQWAQPITYVDIHEGENFTLMVHGWKNGQENHFYSVDHHDTNAHFCFPTSAVIPLHDHPGMTVFSKVLYGSLHLKAYDWVEPARIKKFRELTILQYIHTVSEERRESALFYCNNSLCYSRHPRAPYVELAGRRCSYYRDYPFSGFSGEDDKSGNGDEELAWLAQIEPPRDLYMVSGDYMGPLLRNDFPWVELYSSP